MNFPTLPKQLFATALALLVFQACETSTPPVAPAPQAENRSYGSELEYEEFSVIALEQIDLNCDAFSGNECDNLQELGLGSAPLVYSGFPPMPCEPDGGIFFPRTQFSLYRERPSLKPGASAPSFSGEEIFLEPKEVGGESLEEIAGGRNTYLVSGPVCWPPVGPSPKIELNFAGVPSEGNFGLLYQEGKLVAVALSEKGEFNKEKNLTTVRFEQIASMSDKGGKYTFDVYSNQFTQEGAVLPVVLRFSTESSN